jgi:hypothetical protein
MMLKKRLPFAIAFIFTIGLGLFVRSSWVDFPAIIDEYLGDIIWGGMTYFLFGMVFPERSLRIKALIALAFSYSIELSQLLDYEWLETLRQNRFMALILGFGFKFSDLLCYTVGIGLALIIDKLFKLSA